MLSPSTVIHSLEGLFDSPSAGEAQDILGAYGFARVERRDADHTLCLVDSFPTLPGAKCCFVRLEAGAARTVRFHLQGTYGVHSCPSGGWLVSPAQASAPTYWIPQLPVLRTVDDRGRITSERPVSWAGLDVADDALAAELKVPCDWYLDWTIWRFSPQAAHIPAALERPLNIETQTYFLWGSKVNLCLPGDVYLYLLYGHVYTNNFVWPRKWKFCSEIDAYGLYLALDGLEFSSGKPFYGLLKRQILGSVMARQAADGGWYQGEWTDLMESHYRLHNSAMLMLESALEETADEKLRAALERAAGFLAACTDRTDIGLWFLHDSLESSVEAMEVMRQETNTPWLPSRTFGKSPTNKLILNTHLDAIIALDRYRQVTGDERYAEHVNSARAATRALLSLRPAEALYRLIYWAINLTLLPKKAAMALPAPLRAIKRFTWMYLTPQLHRVKRIFPRIVMPGGLIERHIAPLHYDINYHPVNVMDLARYWRRFPDEDLAAIVDSAVKAVENRQLLDFWSEAKPRRFAVVEWIDALYHLCTLSPDLRHRDRLARAMIRAQDAGLGLPPALLGGDGEVARRSVRMPCPSPTHAHLLVANLSRGQGLEVLVVNPTGTRLPLAWEQHVPDGRKALDALTWSDEEGRGIVVAEAPVMVPKRGWVLGRASIQADGAVPSHRRREPSGASLCSGATAE